MRRLTTISAVLCLFVTGAGYVTAQEPTPAEPGAPQDEGVAPPATTPTDPPPTAEPTVEELEAIDAADRRAEERRRRAAARRRTAEREAKADEAEAAERATDVTDGDDKAGADEADDPEAEARAAERRRERRAGRRLVRRLAVPGTTFPVWRADGFDDTFGAARQIGAHQGNDLFADFGAPVLAVADGIVEKVGTLPISGNRLWLRTPAGDEFFYAHLSSFSPQAQNGRPVKAGTVLGFVGTTGDAETTAPHVHFEIHPRGRDAVDPYPVLQAWKRQGDIGATAWLRRYGTDTAERPGALLPRRDYLAGG